MSILQICICIYGVVSIFFLTIISIKVNTGKFVLKYIEENLRTTKNQFTLTVYKNFIEVALMPKFLFNISTLVSIAHFFILIFNVYNFGWIFGLSYFFIVSLLSNILEKSRDFKALMFIVFYRELNKKINSNKINDSEKLMLKEIIYFFDERVL